VIITPRRPREANASAGVGTCPARRTVPTRALDAGLDGRGERGTRLPAVVPYDDRVAVDPDGPSDGEGQFGRHLLVDGAADPRRPEQCHIRFLDRGLLVDGGHGRASLPLRNVRDIDRKRTNGR